jgi:ureidoglycolate hydrolase
MFKIQKLTVDSFKKYGIKIEATDDKILVARSDVTHWHNLSNLSSLGENPVIAMVSAFKKEFKITDLERHKDTSEIFFPVKGAAAMPFATSMADEKPDFSSLKVFLLEEGQPFIINRGIWHCSPFPISDRWDSYLLVEEKLIKSDIEEFKLEQSYLITL